MKRFVATLLCVWLVAPGCAMTQRTAVQTTPPGQARTTDRDVLADFAGQLKIGSRVKATVAGNRVVRGTLMKRTDQTIVIQPRGRYAEPLVDVPFDELLALEQEIPSSGSSGRAIAIGAAVGAGAAIGTLFLLAALLWAD